MRRFSNITTTQLARICGVLQGTVDRALHNRGEINPETKAKILAVAKEYGYAPSLQKGGGKKVGRCSSASCSSIYITGIFRGSR